MKKNVVYNVVYQVIFIFTQFFTVSYLSNKIGAAGLGEYTLAVIYANYTVIFAELGISRYASREIAYCRENKEAVGVLFKEIMFMRICTYCAVTVIYYLLFFKMNLNNSNAVKINIILVLSYAIDISWLFIGLENLKVIVLKNSCIRVIMVFLIVLFVKNETHVFRSTAIIAISTAIGQFILWKDVPDYIRSNFFKKMPKGFLRDIRGHLIGAFSLFIPEIAIQVYIMLDKIILGNIAGNYELGIYEGACKTVEITRILQSAVTATAPTMAHYMACGKRREYMQNAYRSFSYVNFIVFPLCMGMIGVAGNMVPWFLGNDFLAAVPMVYLSAWFIVTKGWSCVLGDQILMTAKKQKYYTIGVSSGAVINIILNFILIFKYKSMGVLIASVIAEYLGMLIMLWAVVKKLDFQLKILYKGTVKYFLCAGLMGGIVYFMGSKLQPAVLHTILLVILGAVIYTLMMIFTKDRMLFEILKQASHYISQIFDSREY